MTDPVSGAGSNAASEVAKQSGASETSGAEGPSSSDGESFDDVMGRVQDAENDGPDAADVDSADQAEQVGAPDEVDGIEGPARARLDEFVVGINEDQAEIEQMLRRGMDGGQMSQKDLLQTQALIYGFSQRVELASKAVSNATSGVKQVMNTQV